MAKGSGTILQGSDGKLVKVTLGTELVGDGSKDLDTLGAPAGTTKYQISAMAASGSVFAAGYEVGDVFWDDGETLVMVVGDKCYPLSESDQCDVQSWSLDFSRDSVEVTTLCDDNKVYLAGKADITGSINGVFKIGTTDADGGFLNSFIDIYTDSIGSSATINAIDQSDIYVELVKQKSETTGDIFEMYYAPVVITSFSDSAEEGSAQSFSANFRIADDLKLYRRTIS